MWHQATVSRARSTVGSPRAVPVVWTAHNNLSSRILRTSTPLTPPSVVFAYHVALYDCVTKAQAYEENQSFALASPRCPEELAYFILERQRQDTPPPAKITRADQDEANL